MAHFVAVPEKPFIRYSRDLNSILCAAAHQHGINVTEPYTCGLSFPAGTLEYLDGALVVGKRIRIRLIRVQNICHD